VTSNSSAVHLAYISAIDRKPYYASFDGKSWSNAQKLADVELSDNISITADLATNTLLIAWDRGGSIEYITGNGTTWGKTQVAASDKYSFSPQLPPTYLGDKVRIFFGGVVDKLNQILSVQAL
jgi:hypothetical protein